ALTGALAAGGKTVAVLGCAVNYPYLMQNQKMREHIAKTGALISEYPPGTPPSKTTFPCRNRLISGISLGTAVIEASGKSGSLITANFAVDQGRDVFVLPGRADSPNYAGSLRLLEDGAKPVYKARDILEEYARMYPHRLDMRDVDKLVTEPADDLPGFMLAEEKTTKTSPNPNKKSAQTIQTGERIKKNILEGVSQNALIVYNAFDNATLQCDEAARKSGLPIGQVLSAITELEIAGCLEALPGNRYKAL
ncbi:MAG TPA: hypothetical protein DEQ02_09930, partial [Ruminococcaceae bacterium]|nr:hypothetical protein [Oscillospiraceae bacterium]